MAAPTTAPLTAEVIDGLVPVVRALVVPPDGMLDLSGLGEFLRVSPTAEVALKSLY